LTLSPISDDQEDDKGEPVTLVFPSANLDAIAEQSWVVLYSTPWHHRSHRWVVIRTDLESSPLSLHSSSQGWTAHPEMVITKPLPHFDPILTIIYCDTACQAHLDTQCVCYHISKLIYIEGKGWKVVNILDDWICGSDYSNMWINFGSNVNSIKIGCKQTQLDHMIRVTATSKAILPCNIVFVKIFRTRNPFVNVICIDP